IRLNKMLKALLFIVLTTDVTKLSAETNKENEITISNLRQVKRGIRNLLNEGLDEVKEDINTIKQLIEDVNERLGDIAEKDKCRNETRKITSLTLGCYKDTRDRDLPLFHSYGDMTLEKCLKGCHEEGYVYAGIQIGAQCWCGNSYGKHGKVDDSECTIKCTGEPWRICGDHWKNNIYRIEFVGEGNTKIVRHLQ
ncbi:unnamed protein product, partial [Owenia fusiformis]